MGRWTVLCVVALAWAGCGGGEDGAGTGTGTATGTPGKSVEPPQLGKADDQLSVLEAGRLTGDGSLEGTIDGASALAYRFNTFGDAQIQVTLTSPGDEMDPYLVIDGPIPGSVNRIVAFNDDEPSGETFASRVEVTLPEPGAYRILVASYGTYNDIPSDAGAFRLDFSCLTGCEMPQITLGELIAGLLAEVGTDAARDALATGIGLLFADSETAAAVQAQVDALLADPTSIERFPVLPLDLTDTAQGLFEADEVAPEPPGPVHFDVGEILLQGCSAKRSSLEPVDPRLPGLMTGSYADYSIDDCTLQRTQAFADVLNNLALENGSTVTHEGQTYESIQAVMEALLAAGHRVVITNDRYFADFLGLYYNGAAVVAPVWLETTIPLVKGGFLALPAPHTHHTIEVTGPLVNATIMYYMGVSGGVSFRAVSNLRSPWTGKRVRYTYDSQVDPQAVVDLMVTAGQLRKKWTAEAAGLPALGYGTLGVCNDSTAVLEYSQEQAVSIFPLAHRGAPAEPPDAIDDILASLPADTAGYETSEALQRVFATLPLDDYTQLPFPKLVQTLQELDD